MLPQQTIAITVFFFILLLLMLFKDNETFPYCYGLGHNSCLKHIDCQWSGYYNSCHPRVYDSAPIYRSYYPVTWWPRSLSWWGPRSRYWY